MTTVLLTVTVIMGTLSLLGVLRVCGWCWEMSRREPKPSIETPRQGPDPTQPSVFSWRVVFTWEEFQDEVLRGDSKTSVHDRLVLLEKEDGWVRYGPGCVRTWNPKSGWIVFENQPGAAEKWLG